MPQYVWPWLLAAALLSSVDADAPIRLAPQGKGRDGHYIIKFQDDTPDEVMQNVVDSRPKNKSGKKYKSFPMVKLSGVTDTELQQLATITGAALLEQDAVVNATDYNWGLDRIDQDYLPLNGTYSPYGTGAGAVVYIVDMGFQLDHDQYNGRAFDFYDGVDSNNKKRDPACYSHGTMVAGVIGGKDYGVAPGALLYSARVLDCTGSGYISTVIDALDNIRQHPVKPSTTSVINLSLGGPYSEALNDAIQKAFDAGFVVVASAGNEDTDASGASPASAPAALTVGSTNSTDARSGYSNYGTSVNIFAPGENIFTSASSDQTSATTYFSGTSASAPFVSGAAALFLGTNSTATSAEVRNFVLSTAVQNTVTDPVGSPNRLVHVQYSCTNTNPILNECQSVTAQYVERYEMWQSGPSPSCSYSDVKKALLDKGCKVAKDTCYTIVCDNIPTDDFAAIKELCN